MARRQLDFRDHTSAMTGDPRRVFDQLTGKVSAVGLTRPYWRTRIAPSDDPDEIDVDRDGCGFAFVGAVAPYQAKHIRRVLEIATPCILEHGFEPSIGALPVRERTAQFHISIAYNRAVDAEDARALDAVRDTSRRLCDAGYHPQRLGIPTMGVMALADPMYRSVLAKLKAALDPKSIVAPGRYASSD